MLIEHPCYVLRYMGVELAQWRLFLAVADEGSLGRAAVRLGTDQPASSRAVRRLELAVGTPLLICSPTGTTLTAAGARLLEQAHNPVAAADTLDDADVVARTRPACCGSARLTSTHSPLPSPTLAGRCRRGIPRSTSS